jgi:hypothetical protein
VVIKMTMGSELIWPHFRPINFSLSLFAGHKRKNLSALEKLRQA